MQTCDVASCLVTSHDVQECGLAGATLAWKMSICVQCDQGRWNRRWEHFISTLFGPDNYKEEMHGEIYGHTHERSHLAGRKLCRDSACSRDA